MRARLIVSIVCATSVLAGVALIVACKTESASENNVRITPALARLAKGESQQFTASGGYDYSWTLDGGAIADEWGYLSETRGARTVYTSTKDASTAGTFRAIHVVSTISGAGGTSGSTDTNLPTTTSSYAMSAEAFVEHAVEYSILNVSPAAVSGFKYGQSQTFSASGGNGTYSWNLENDSLGELTSLSGASTTYSSTLRASDDNTVNRLRCLSGDGQAVNVVIFHANEAVTSDVSSLSLSPASTTLSVNQSATFTVAGGDGAYSWSLSTRDYGTLTFPSANTASFLCTTAESTNNVVVRLTVTSNGETRQATIVISQSSGEALRVTPAAVTLAQGQTATFTAAGGAGDYTWSPSTTAYGTLTVSSPTTASYVSLTFVPTNAPVTVIITVTDGDGSTVDAQVVHRN